MKQNENILLSTATVKLLTMKELHSVRFMDVVSDFYVEQWLEENTDYPQYITNALQEAIRLKKATNIYVYKKEKNILFYKLAAPKK